MSKIQYRIDEWGPSFCAKSCVVFNKNCVYSALVAHMSFKCCNKIWENATNLELFILGALDLVINLFEFCNTVQPSLYLLCVDAYCILRGFIPLWISAKICWIEHEKHLIIMRKFGRCLWQLFMHELDYSFPFYLVWSKDLIWGCCHLSHFFFNSLHSPPPSKKLLSSFEYVPIKQPVKLLIIRNSILVSPGKQVVGTYKVLLTGFMKWLIFKFHLGNKIWNVPK